MGHDISAYRKQKMDNSSFDSMTDEIAYIRFGAFNRNSWLLYEALDAHDCNGGVSGNGEQKTFTKKEIETAKSKLKYLSGETSQELMDSAKSDHDEKAMPMLNMVMEMLGGRMKKDEVDEEEEKRMLKENIEYINEFLDKILDETTEEDEIVIGFY